MSDLDDAAQALRLGQLVVYPTETYYGLAADPFCPEAVERVFEAKGRPAGMAIPLIFDDPLTLEDLADHPPPLALALAELFWPGPLTLVLRARDKLPPRLLGDTGTVALRRSSHPTAASLAGLAGGAISATSANSSGQGPFSTAAQAAASLLVRPAVVLDRGPTKGQAPSTILDLTGPQPIILRAGALPTREIELALGWAEGSLRA